MQIKELYKKFLKAKGADIKYRNLAAGKKIDVSKKGLWDKKKKQVIVPSNRITMKGPNGEQDFFKKPVVATGLQSGHQVMMQPGGEYYFPNDRAVHEVRMQNGGSILSMGDYDLTTAPKKGNYLLPDINRPSYKDESGNKRSEYKMGFNIDGKETILPTVVNGRQLSEDEAVARYRNTGLNMGQYNTPEEADYAARSRTAKYNMLEDPIRFQANQFQVGGTLPPIYTSNPRDPRIGSYRDSLNLYNEQNRLNILNNKTNYPQEAANFPPIIKNNLIYVGDPNKGGYVNPKIFSSNIPTLSKDIHGNLKQQYKKPVQPVIYKKPEVSPIYTSDLNDPRLRSYNDSLSLYNQYLKPAEINKTLKEIKNDSRFRYYRPSNRTELNNFPGKIKPILGTEFDFSRIDADLISGRSTKHNYYPTYDSSGRIIPGEIGTHLSFKKPVQPYIYKKPEVVPEVIETPVAPVVPVAEPPVKKVGYNKPIIQQFNYMSNENKAKALQKYGSVGDIPFQGVDINQLKDGGWLEQYQDGGTIQTDITTPIRKKPSPSQDAFNAMLDEYEASKTTPEEDASVPEDMGFQSGGELPVVIDSLFSNFRSGIGRKYAQNGMAVPGVNGTVVANTNAPINSEKLKMQTGAWANWTPNTEKPYLRTSPAGNAGYSDNTKVVTQNTNVSAANRKAAEAGEYARKVGSISQGKVKSNYEKAKEASSLVAQAQQRKGSADPLDYVLDTVNPATYAFAATDLVGNTGSAISNTAQGNFKEAGSDLLNAGLNALYLLPAKGIAKAIASPMAFRPVEGMMYRGLGKEGFKDAVQSGVFRPKQLNYTPGRSFAERVNSPKQFGSTYYAPSKKFGVIENYGPDYVAEVPYNEADFFRRYSKRNDWSYSTPKQIPITEGKILKKDWLLGYKQIKKPEFKDGGETDHDDDKDMVNGVASILRRVKDKDNRQDLANQLSKQFDREKVRYNLSDFLKKSKVKK